LIVSDIYNYQIVLHLRAAIKELLSYRHVFSWKRAGNVLLVIGAYFLSRWTNRSIVAPAPIAISVEPTTVCNLKCPQCPTGAGTLMRSKGTMELALFQSIIDQLSPATFIINLYLQGEPLLNPAIGEFIRLAHVKRLYTILSTNGQLLDGLMCNKLVASGLSKIIVSLDGLTEQSYAQYRVGGSLQKVLDGLKLLQSAKEMVHSQLPFVELQFIAFEHNEKEINEIKNIARRYRVDRLTVKTAQIINSQNNVRPATQRGLTRYVNNSRGQQMKGRSYRHCFKIWHSMVFTWDGTAAPCCYDKDLTHSHGNLFNTSMNTLWRDAEIQHFRKTVQTQASPLEICSNCPENRKWVL